MKIYVCAQKGTYISHKYVYQAFSLKFEVRGGGYFGGVEEVQDLQTMQSQGGMSPREVEVNVDSIRQA